MSHFWVPETWTHSLGTGVVEIPVWVGIGIISHRRAKRRAQAAQTGAAPTADSAISQ